MKNEIKRNKRIVSQNPIIYLIIRTKVYFSVATLKKTYESIIQPQSSYIVNM